MKLSEKYLEEKCKSAELALNPYGICKIYGAICRLEGIQQLAEAEYYQTIQKELNKIAKDNNL